MKAINTGNEPVTLSAMEQFADKDLRIFTDDYAIKMLTPGMRFFIRLCRFPRFRNWIISSSEKAMPGGYAGILYRKQYIDQKIISCVDKISALVEIGAGYDSRALRISSKYCTPFFELDYQKTMAEKKSIIQRSAPSLLNRVHFYGIDLDHDKIEDEQKLVKELTQLKKPLFFVLEAVTQYLTENGIESVFQFLEKAPEDSYLAFTYVDRDFLGGRDLMHWEAAYRKYVKQGIWRFGLTKKTSKAFLNKYGWELLEDITPENISSKELLAKRGLQVSSVERFVFARKL